MIPRVNWSVEDFCKAHSIGRTLFYDEVKRGELAVIKVGTRTVVSAAAAEAWQKRKEDASRRTMSEKRRQHDHFGIT